MELCCLKWRVWANSRKGIFVRSLASHYNANSLVADILKLDKIWGAVCISVPHSKFWGLVLMFLVIYAPNKAI